MSSHRMWEPRPPSLVPDLIKVTCSFRDGYKIEVDGQLFTFPTFGGVILSPIARGKQPGIQITLAANRVEVVHAI